MSLTTRLIGPVSLLDRQLASACFRDARPVCDYWIRVGARSCVVCEDDPLIHPQFQHWVKLMYVAQLPMLPEVNLLIIQMYLLDFFGQKKRRASV